MLHAAAMLAGLFAAGVLLLQGWAVRDGALLAFAAALVSVAAALRLGGVRRNPFSAAPQFLTLLAPRVGDVMRGTLATIRAALAADIALKPALVRVRAESSSGLAAALAADAISAEPGRVIVETDSDGMLAHVINEDAAEADDIGRVQRRAASLLGSAS